MRRILRDDLLRHVMALGPEWASKSRLGAAQAKLHGNRVVRALMPLSVMFGYVSDLHSKTSGQASYSMEFDSYAETPKNISEEIVAKARGGE